MPHLRNRWLDRALITRPVVLAFLILSGVNGLPQTVKNSLSNRQGLLLLHPLHASGQVVGEDGPIAEARLNHINLPVDLRTDLAGRFDFDTSAPSFVVEMPGFQSVLVHTGDATDLRIVLRKIANLPHPPTCVKADVLGRTPGWGGIIQVPKRPEIHASREVMDVDYWARTVRVKSGPISLQIMQGRGPMWGGGQLRDEDVWRSVAYREQAVDLEGQLLTDAKAWLPSGKCTREVGVFGESIGYQNVDCIHTEALDRVLDGLCIIPGASGRLLSP